MWMSKPRAIRYPTNKQNISECYIDRNGETARVTLPAGSGTGADMSGLDELFRRVHRVTMATRVYTWLASEKRENRTRFTARSPHFPTGVPL